MASKNKKTNATKKSAPAKKSVAHAPAKKPAPAKKSAKPAPKKSIPVKKSAPAKKVATPAKKPTKVAPKKSAKPVKAAPAKKSSETKNSAPAPRKSTPNPVSPTKAKAPAPAKKSAPAKNSAPKKSSGKSSKKSAKTSASAHSGIVVRRDAETVQTKVITRRSGFTAYSPKELEQLFARRGTENLNLFDPELTEKKDAPKKSSTGKQILKALPKAKPRKIGAVSLNDLFGYNPFAKDSVSAEEKMIPQKWIKYYKKLTALRSAIQKEIDEHSQTAFNRESKEDSGDVSASYSQHTADIDNEAFTRDCALSLLAGKQQELAEINIAIERMKKGTYGICEITGKPIPAERLRDVPYTRYSIEGKIEAEKQRQAAARRHLANTTTDISSVTDIENDVPIVFNDDDEADRKKGESEPSSEEESK